MKHVNTPMTVFGRLQTSNNAHHLRLFVQDMAEMLYFESHISAHVVDQRSSLRYPTRTKPKHQAEDNLRRGEPAQ